VPVTAIGYPLGQTSVKVTKGILSGHEQVGEFAAYQQTAPISPGNSGGPLFIDGTNEVLGINFAAAVGANSQSNNYAIPAQRVLQMLREFDASWSAQHAEDAVLEDLQLVDMAESRRGLPPCLVPCYDVKGIARRHRASLSERTQQSFERRVVMIEESLDCGRDYVLAMSRSATATTAGAFHGVGRRIDADTEVFAMDADDSEEESEEEEGPDGVLVQRLHRGAAREGERVAIRADVRPEKVRRMLETGRIEALCATMEKGHLEVAEKAVQSLEHILRVGEQDANGLFDRLAFAVKDCGGLRRLEELADSKECATIADRAALVLVQFFDEVDLANDSFYSFFVKEAER